MRLDGKVVIITGGGRNIGREITLTLAEAGAQVVCTGTTLAPLDETAQAATERGARALALVCDVSDEAAVSKLVQTTLNEFGQIDILVNNAGIAGPTARATEIDRQAWDETLAINLTGPFLTAKHVLPLMAERRRGRIINIASVAGQHGYALRSPYAASKWGLIGLSRTLALEWGPCNIQINTVVPGPIEGERMTNVIAQRARSTGRPDAEVRAEYTRTTALQRFATEHDVATMCLFLASEAGANLTGQTFNVCAGYGL